MFKKNNFGFSLVEVLVTISIISLISVVAIPNLRNFSKTEDVKNVAKDVINTLRTARSNSLTNQKCPNGSSSDYWKVRITPDNYSLIVMCQEEDEITEVTVNTYSYFARDNVGTGVVIEGSTDKCLDNTTDIVYKNKDFHFYCTNQGVSDPIQRNDLKVILNDKDNEDNFVEIEINKAGLINDV